MLLICKRCIKADGFRISNNGKGSSICFLSIGINWNRSLENESKFWTYLDTNKTIHERWGISKLDILSTIRQLRVLISTIIKITIKVHIITKVSVYVEIFDIKIPVNLIIQMNSWMMSYLIHLFFRLHRILRRNWN